MTGGKIATFTQVPFNLTAMSVAVVILVLLGQADALSSPHNLPYTPNFFQHLSEEPRESGVAAQGTPQETASGQQHLMKLLSMKDSLSELLSPGQAEGLSDSGMGGSASLVTHDRDDDDDVVGVDDVDDIDSDLQPPQDKRVFCNGFTGCGGRFRAQRRRQGQHDTDKRVFCNSQGCGNGRKRAMSNSGRNGGRDDENHRGGNQASRGGRVNMELWKQALKRLEEIQLGKLRGLSKRLFCNNYGGCHNVGKKRHSSMATAQQVAASGSFLPKLDFLSHRQQHSQRKRFFASGFDGDVDALVDSLR